MNGLLLRTLAGQGAVAARAHRQGVVDECDLGTGPRSSRGVRGVGSGVGPREIRSGPRRPRRVHRRALCERLVLRDASASARSSDARLRKRTTSAGRRSRRAGRRHQRSGLAPALRRACRCRRQVDPAQSQAVHDRWRRAARLHGPDRGARLRRVRPASGRSTCSATGPRTRSTRAPGGGSTSCSDSNRARLDRRRHEGAARECSRRSGKRPSPQDWPPQDPERLPARWPDARERRGWPRRAAPGIRRTARGVDGGRRARAPGRVRQHREPAARTRDGAPPRARDAPGARGVGVAARAAAADRKSAALRPRVPPSGCSSRSGQAGCSCPSSDVPHDGRARPAARLAPARVHGRRHDPHGARVRHRSGPAARPASIRTTRSRSRAGRSSATAVTASQARSSSRRWRSRSCSWSRPGSSSGRSPRWRRSILVSTATRCCSSRSTRSTGSPRGGAAGAARTHCPARTRTPRRRRRRDVVPQPGRRHGMEHERSRRQRSRACPRRTAWCGSTGSPRATSGRMVRGSSPVVSSPRTTGAAARRWPIVTEAFVRAYLKKGQPLGRTFSADLGGPGKHMTASRSWASWRMWRIDRFATRSRPPRTSHSGRGATTSCARTCSRCAPRRGIAPSSLAKSLVDAIAHVDGSLSLTFRPLARASGRATRAGAPGGGALGVLRRARAA